MTKLKPLVAVGVAGLMSGAGALAQDTWTYPVDVWETPFDMASPTHPKDYVPLEGAQTAHTICASFPHMTDAYWLAANYGMISEARRQGVDLHIVEAGGYTELNRQLSQIEDCVASGAEAVIIGAISYDGTNNLIADLKARDVVVVDTINGVSSLEIDAKSIISWEQVGFTVGSYLADLHPEGSDPVRVGWFPGPAGAGFVEDATRGFLASLEGSAVEVADVKYGNTSREVQTRLIEDMLEADPDLDYIAGSAVSAEAAIPVLRVRYLSDEIQLLSYYFTPGIRIGIERGQILASASDSTVMQGRLAVDQAIRILEGTDFDPHIGPAIIVITQDNIGEQDMNAHLAPDGFTPVFRSN